MAKKYLDKYGLTIDAEDISRRLDTISSGLSAFSTKDVFLKCFSMMDITSLHNEDTYERIRSFVEKVNEVKDKFPGYPYPASICVFPNFIPTVVSARKDSGIHATSVAGAFPASQTFLDVKVKECVMSVEAGADEVDIVLANNAFLAGEEGEAYGEIKEMREAIDVAAARMGKKVVLKVILETGILQTSENIAEASFLAMEAGADFIKTSTGKVSVNATPAAAIVMCRSIRKYYEATGKKVGFKAAGGISTAQDALSYYAIVSAELGSEWLCPELSRFGVSRLGNALMSEIEHNTVNYF